MENGKELTPEIIFNYLVERCRSRVIEIPVRFDRVVKLFEAEIVLLDYKLMLVLKKHEHWSALSIHDVAPDGSTHSSLVTFTEYQHKQKGVEVDALTHDLPPTLENPYLVQVLTSLRDEIDHLFPGGIWPKFPMHKVQEVA